MKLLGHSAHSLADDVMVTEGFGVFLLAGVGGWG